MAYIYSEQDNYDLNYFIHYNMAKLKLARVQFQRYLQEKIAENRQVMKIIQNDYHLNRRQLKLLQYLAKDEQRYTTLSQYHANNSDVSKVSAMFDLKKLVEAGFLNKIRNGRNVYYYPTPKIHTIVK